MCIKWIYLQKAAFVFQVLSFLVILPAGTAVALDTYPEYGATVDSNGETGIGRTYPKEVLQKAWDHCGESGCDGKLVCILNTTETIVCGPRNACTYPISRTVKFTGSYSGGWATRDKMVNALLKHSGNDGGWYNQGSWIMRSFWAVRTPGNTSWINVNVEGGRESMTACDK
ncbi:MAG: hypothetical protein KME42_28700 [Tildeniella nuda ZEHNDER 1965/U140]|jgi:hypothetical protein|nr:hypothetical protein [Tildeniella nuda ZEHNDER 1965/U140]